MLSVDTGWFLRFTPGCIDVVLWWICSRHVYTVAIITMYISYQQNCYSCLYEAMKHKLLSAQTEVRAFPWTFPEGLFLRMQMEVFLPDPWKMSDWARVNIQQEHLCKSQWRALVQGLACALFQPVSPWSSTCMSLCSKWRWCETSVQLLPRPRRARKWKTPWQRLQVQFEIWDYMIAFRHRSAHIQYAFADVVFFFSEGQSDSIFTQCT